MKVLTVQPPWSWALSLDPPDRKDIENRTFAPKYTGLVHINSGKRWSERGAEDPLMVSLWEKYSQWLGPDNWKREGIICTVNLVDVHPAEGCCYPWGEDKYVEHPSGRVRRTLYHWVTELVERHDPPLVCKGTLGLREYEG